MSKRGNGYGSENRVNILKKSKVGKNWNLYRAVVEPNGELREKVRVRGKAELHPEGYYYLDGIVTNNRTASEKSPSLPGASPYRSSDG